MAAIIQGPAGGEALIEPYAPVRATEVRFKGDGTNGVRVQSETGILQVKNKANTELAPARVDSDLSNSNNVVTVGDIGAAVVEVFETLPHSGLLGLDNDDHPQYSLVDGSRGFTATISGVSPVQSYHLSTKGYIDSRIPEDPVDFLVVQVFS